MSFPEQRPLAPANTLPRTCKWEDVMTYLSFLPIDLNSRLNVYCTLCQEDIEPNASAKVLYCGHIYHTHCLDMFYERADASFDPEHDGCAGCDMPNRHATCTCRIVAHPMPPSLMLASALPRVCALGGSVNDVCNAHLLRYSLRSLCADAHEHFNEPGTGQIVAATDGTLVCWASENAHSFADATREWFTDDTADLRWKCETHSSRLRGLTEMTSWIEYRFSNGQPRFVVGKTTLAWLPQGNCQDCLKTCPHNMNRQY